MLMLRKVTTFLFMSLSYPVMANSPSTSNSGTIYFHGTIVEPPCQFNWDKNYTKMLCWYNGKQFNQEKTIEYQKDNNSPLSMPKYIGKEEIKWIGKNKKLGIITITYH